MKISKNYLPCVVMTILMVFLFLCGGALMTKNKALDNSFSSKISDDYDLDLKVKICLEKHFEEKYNATGIPADVYMSSLSEQWIDNTIKSSMNSGFNYLTDKNSAYVFEPDYSLVDTALEDFFNKYADENDIEKDSTFETKLTSVKENAHSTINSFTDVFKFDTLNSEGVLSQLKVYIMYINKPIVTAAVILLTLISIALVIFFQRKNLSMSLYWIGISLLISAIIGAVPCIYIKATSLFDSFVIKQEQIFIAFTSYMYNVVNYFLMLTIIAAVLGIIMLLARGALSRKSIKKIG